MSAPQAIGIRAYDLRLMKLPPSRTEPYALVVGVADCGHMTGLAAGTRREMRDLRTRLLIGLRRDHECLEQVAKALAGAVRRLPPADDATPTEGPADGST